MSWVEPEFCTIWHSPWSSLPLTVIILRLFHPLSFFSMVPAEYIEEQKPCAGPKPGAKWLSAELGDAVVMAMYFPSAITKLDPCDHKNRKALIMAPTTPLSQRARVYRVNKEPCDIPQEQLARHLKAAGVGTPHVHSQVRLVRACVCTQPRAHACVA